MRNWRYLLPAVFFLALLPGCCTTNSSRDRLFQVSTINALFEGIYEGSINWSQLKKHGDFGIGTFEGLDGEMVVLDEKCYQVKIDGVAYEVGPSIRIPFAAVTFFEADQTNIPGNNLNYQQLTRYLDGSLPSKNLFYAIKIEGTFDYIKTRSVPKQTKPYPALSEVVKNQRTFEFRNVKGTVVGFYCPTYAKGFNTSGYHFHFLTEDRKSGGHLLDCRTKSVKVKIDRTPQFYVVLPENAGFLEVDLTKETEVQVNKVENQK
ncbi:MAG: acetolactate decarboxylase [Candidatus Omnitrophota bacterium]